MSKKSDDSIERIFRQVLTQYDPNAPSIKDDWVKMEQMLVAEERRLAEIRLRRNKGIAFTVAGLIGLLTAVYFLSFKNPWNSHAEHKTTSSKTQGSGDTELKKDANADLPSGQFLTLDSQRFAQKDSRNQSDAGRAGGGLSAEDSQEGIIKKKSPGEPPGDGMVTPAIDSKPSRHAIAKMQPDENADQDLMQLNKESQPGELDGKRQPLTSKKDSIVANRQPDAAQQGTPLPAKSSPGGLDGSLGRTGITDGNLNTLTLTDSAGNPVDGGRAGISSEELKNSTDSATVTKQFVPESDSVHSAKDQELEATRRSPLFRFSVGLVFAPEFSATSMDSYSTPGESVGLRIAYQISPRVSVNTGLIRSMKKYVGSGYDYQPVNPAYWRIRTNGVVPEEIDSRCLVYEIPISIRFDVIQTSKSSVYLSAATSSFFMANQHYAYKFSDPNPGADMEWSTSRSENYWFNAGMISAGYERNIGSAWAIGIEPYLKIPFSEIGWPNVKLFSTGGYVTLRYKFMMKQY